MTEKILKVSSIGLTKLNNAEYLRLMSRFSGQIKQVDASKLGLPKEKVDAFDKNLLLLNDVFAQNRAVAETATLQELDKQRDQQWVYLFQRIRVAISSPLEVERKASEVLTPEIKPYVGKQEAALEQQTQLIKGFIFDMQKSENFAQIEVLGLVSALEALEDFNNRYASLSDTRETNKQTTKVPSGEALRKENDPLYDYLTNKLFAENLSNPTEETTATLLALNSFIEAANTAYKRRMAQGGKAPAEEQTTEKD